MFFSTLFYAFICWFIAGAQAALNDWTVPCNNGVCYYDLPTSGSQTLVSGSLKIWGNRNAISDITTAAGWEILGCDPDANNQKIRLVCVNDTADCEHLFEDTGPKGKIIRLPESCGKGPFARVARSWIPKDQSIPDSVAKRMVRRDGELPVVNALQFDQNFSAINPSVSGPVNFQVQAANVPGADKEVFSPSRRSSRIYRRGLGDFLEGALDDLNVSLNKASDPIPIDVSQNASLFTDTITCGPTTAAVNIDATGEVHAVVTFGIAAEGSVIPPSISSFAITSQLTADLSGTVSLRANVGGTLSSGKIPVASVGIPGLDIPGILSIGPTLEINAEAIASLNISANADVTFKYHLEKAQLTFPPRSDSTSSAPTTLQDSPISLSLSRSVTSTGKLEAHLIPSINFGIDAIGGVAKAQVFLELDSSASMELTLGVTLDPVSIVGSRSESEEPADSTSDLSFDRMSAISQHIPRQSEGDTTNENLFGGCFEIDTGIDINAGADADFFGLFDTSTKINLFTKNFQLFKKCFGAPQSRRSTATQRHLLPSLDKRAEGLTCFGPATDLIFPIVDKTVSAASAKLL